MKITKAHIDRYLKGECTPVEAAAIEQYLDEHPQALDELFPEKEWQSTPDDVPYIHQEHVYQNIQKHIEPRKNYRLYMRKVVSIAALFLFVFGIYWFIADKSTPPQLPSRTVTKSTSHPQETEVANLYYINSGNENMMLTASDGTVITLYPQSEIKYAEDFSKQHERILQLKGKAKFEVAKDKTKPFRVYAQGVVTTALGTVFIVDEIKKSEIRIQLLEGSIEVTSNNPKAGKPLIRKIKPDEEITFDHTAGKIVNEKKINAAGLDRAGYFLQQPQVLQFKNLALQDVIAILQQNYNIDIQYEAANLKDKFFSGSFTNTAEAYQQIIQEINYLHATHITYSKTTTKL
ncbi:FecR family protein [Sphingobacterium sp. SRCM116780]|uniref:FecR family protein n=1 Tax=Sphingobacterium sp. SRCM116780 TaxID=2907623 RepID=UPI001F1CE06B|nr:FecR family protein [Sphingobacterium sp. SRCM116780]UIR54748.1 FecR family protein [Sphingobacterium sp. SRCM116780]